MAVSPDGRYLVAAGGSGASVFSVSHIEQPNSASSSWLLGSFSSRGHGAIEATVSPDGDYVFVSLEDSEQLAVFNLKKAERSGFGSSDLVGYVPMGFAPVGMAISPNGRYLYATSETFKRPGTEGTLTTIDLRRAEGAALSLGRVHGMGRVQSGESGGHRVLGLRDGPGK